MITFVDGPAAGQELHLRRAPILLRVVKSFHDDGWDALDQLGDTCLPGEKLLVYRLTTMPAYFLICARSRSKKAKAINGLWASAAYAILPDQPADAEIRTNAAWAAWCKANKERLMPEWAKNASTEPNPGQ